MEIEYHGNTTKLCAAGNANGFNTVKKRRKLDAKRDQCNAGIESPPLPCTVFPSDNVWNADISALPVHAMSDAWVASIAAARRCIRTSAPSTTGPNGIPYAVVPAVQPAVPTTFKFADESDPGPYPVPPDAPIEGGAKSKGDRHVLLVQADTCDLFEMFSARPKRHGTRWGAGSGARWNLGSNALRPTTWTSADAAGLPILPVSSATTRSRATPSRMPCVSPSRTPSARSSGRRATSRLDDRSHLPADGCALSPQGGRRHLGLLGDQPGDPHRPQDVRHVRRRQRWSVVRHRSTRPALERRRLHALTQLSGSDFEAVDESGLMVDPDSGRCSRLGRLPAPRVVAPHRVQA